MNWKIFRLQIIEYRGNTCQSCKLEFPLQKLYIHHKDRNRSNNNLNNLIIYCASCHIKRHYREDMIILGQYLKNIIELPKNNFIITLPVGNTDGLIYLGNLK